MHIGWERVMREAFKKAGKRFSPWFMVFIAMVLFSQPCQAEGTSFRNGLGMAFVLIPAGTFQMGSPADEPLRGDSELQHTVTLTGPFYMQATEVTLAQWWAVMGKRFFGRRKGQGNMPVAKVSWYDCADFIKALNARTETGFYRFPTEAEWEYACRANSQRAFSWGDAIDCSRALFGNHHLKAGECTDFVQSKGLKKNQPSPVGVYPPNAWGLYDMHGNVWEWCADWFSPYPDEAVRDPLGPESGAHKVKRGGSWMGPGDRCRSANRAHAHPAGRFRTTGFRLVWVPEGPPEDVGRPERRPERTEEGGP